jgi:hypothetical protein
MGNSPMFTYEGYCGLVRGWYDKRLVVTFLGWRSLPKGVTPCSPLPRDGN